MAQPPSTPPSSSSLPIPANPPVHLIHNLLAPSECDELIRKHGPNLSSVATNYADRERSLVDDIDLSALLFERLKKCHEIENLTDEDGQSWSPLGLNPRFRFCKYGPGKE
jgi:hypothetical protein